MSRYIVVLTTTGSKEEASRLSQSLVREKLAYCVNTIPSIQSTYYWEGKLCTDEEFLLLIKTHEEKFTALETWVLQNHNYAVPELIAIPITRGSSDYLKCIDDWVGQ